MFLKMDLLCFSAYFIIFLNATLSLESFSKNKNKDLSQVVVPIYTNTRDGTENVTKSDKPQWVKDHSGDCGVRGGYYFNRIIGGTNAEEGEFPWQVSLQLRTGLTLQHICGGAVVTEHWVITAGHCISGVHPNALSVVAGDHNLYVSEGKEQRRNVIAAFTSNFALATFTNDIALLKTDTPFILHGDSKVSPICLPEAHDKFKGLATVSGWGRLSETGASPYSLQQVTIPIIDQQICRTKYEVAGFSQFLHECQLCAGATYGGKDACQGDSGGPLVCAKDNGKYYICGIVSWGIGCGRPEFPGIYTEVSCYADWINNVMMQNW